MRTTRLPEADRRGGFGHGRDCRRIRPAHSCTPATRRAAKNPVIGKGEHRYECFHGWGEVPSSIHWFETHGVAVDKAGFIYIKHRAGDQKPKSPDEAQDTIVVFDPEGKFVRSFGKEYHGGGHGIDIREENGQEFLYLSCMMPVNLVVKTDLKGEVVWIKEAPTEPHVYDKPGTPFSPTNVAFAPDGGFYVGDGYGSNYIHQYDKDAKWVRTFGGTGDGPGQFKTPHGLWLDNRPGREPQLVVADRANARLQYLTLDGQAHEHHERRRQLPGPLRHPGRRAARARLARPRHAVRQGQQGDRPPRLRPRVDQAGTRRVQDPHPARPLAGRQVHPSARRLLRQGWQHLRRRVGADRPGLAPATRELTEVEAS